MFRLFLRVGLIGLLVLIGVSLNNGTNVVQSAAPTLVNTAAAPTVPPCPDTTKTIQTSTPTLTQTAAATPTGTVTPRPTTVAQSALLNATQTGPFDVIHSLVVYEPGVTSTFLLSPGPTNLIVVDGEVTLCSGNFQRVLKTDETWTIPGNITYRLANTGTNVAQVSVVRLVPQTTATPTAQGTTTLATAAVTSTTTPTVVTATNTPSPTLALPTATNRATSAATLMATNSTASPAFLGIQVAAMDNTALRITGLIANSPATTAKLQVGDVITALNGSPLASLLSNATPDVSGADLVAAFFNKIAAQAPGSQITLTIQRSGQQMDVNVTLASKP